LGTKVQKIFETTKYFPNYFANSNVKIYHKFNRDIIIRFEGGWKGNSGMAGKKKYSNVRSIVEIV
jgi:hypothetical protein